MQESCVLCKRAAFCARELSFVQESCVLNKRAGFCARELGFVQESCVLCKRAAFCARELRFHDGEVATGSVLKDEQTGRVL